MRSAKPVTASRAPFVGADSLGERAHDARSRALLAQKAARAAYVTACQAGASYAASHAGAREKELRGFLLELGTTTRSLEKALAEVARETRRVSKLVEKASEEKASSARRAIPHALLPFRRSR